MRRERYEKERNEVAREPDSHLLATSIADRTVAPQPQNTGISSSFSSIAFPKSGFLTSAIPISDGLPMCTGAPCNRG